MKYQVMQKKTDSELTDLVMATRQELHNENAKDKFAKKSSVIKNAKKTIAQALTEITVRRNQVVK